MVNWCGRWIIAVAVLHCSFALFHYSNSFSDMLSQGLIASARTDATRLASWFLLSGFLLLVVGLLLDHFRKLQLPVPLSVSVLIVVTVAIGLLLMPVSGFWLLLPASLILLFESITANRI